VGAADKPVALQHPKVAPDGLRRDGQLLGEPAHVDAPVVPRGREDPVLALIRVHLAHLLGYRSVITV
jgi:hypothetical protein